MSHRQGELGYAFAPLPHRVRRLREEGVLNANDVDFEALLYSRVNFNRLKRRAETPALTLAQISEGIRWTKTSDALSKLVRKHRDLGLLRYRIVQGKTYVFTLVPDDSPSDTVPEKGDRTAPAKPDPGSMMASVRRREIDAESSALASDRAADRFPMPAETVPSECEPAGAVLNGERALVAPPDGPTSSELQTKANLSEEKETSPTLHPQTPNPPRIPLRAEGSFDERVLEVRRERLEATNDALIAKCQPPLTEQEIDAHVLRIDTMPPLEFAEFIIESRSRRRRTRTGTSR